MQIDELHKFNDEKLNDVQTALDDHLKGIQMKYLPQAIWKRSDKEIASTMIHAIDKQLKTRRIMRSLEKFVEPKGSTQGYLLVSVEVLRYDKRSTSENIGIVPTEMELILEQTQQGISHEVSKLCREALRMLLGTHFGGQTFRHSWGHSPASKQNGGYYGYEQGYEIYKYAQVARDLDSKGNGRWDGVKKMETDKLRLISVGKVVAEKYVQQVVEE
nr:hypothetical protein [Tanacetum cinerariifolium]